jgi:ApaG protein
MHQDSRHQISIDVETTFVDGQSAPDKDHYVFAYTITIENRGEVAARLLSRHWIITDANGKTQEVFGDGVVGEQPFLRPGEHFRYTSGTSLETPVGSMHGSYHMRAEDGEFFEAPIPAFSLATPNSLN